MLVIQLEEMNFEKMEKVGENDENTAENDENAGKKQFYCLVSAETKQKVEDSGCKHAFLVESGLKFIEGRLSQNVETFKNAGDIEKLQKANARLQRVIFDLQDKLTHFEEKETEEIRAEDIKE